MTKTLLGTFEQIYEHQERANIKRMLVYERMKIKFARYSNHLNFLMECKKLEFTTEFIKIRKQFASQRAIPVLRKSEVLILDDYITETRHKLFKMRNSVVECQGLIFYSIEHNKFQSLEILISETITRINNKQQIGHDKILNNARNSILSNHMPTDNVQKLVCNICNVCMYECNFNRYSATRA
jgi:hypothetical protein